MDLMNLACRTTGVFLLSISCDVHEVCFNVTAKCNSELYLFPTPRLQPTRSSQCARHGEARFAISQMASLRLEEKTKKNVPLTYYTRFGIDQPCETA